MHGPSERVGRACGESAGGPEDRGGCRAAREHERGRSAGGQPPAGSKACGLLCTAVSFFDRFDLDLILNIAAGVILAGVVLGVLYFILWGVFMLIAADG